MTTRLEGKVEKLWGHEEIWATNDLYCGKFLHFNKGSSFSMHFHNQKDETWYVLSGHFELITIDTRTATENTEILKQGDVKRIFPLIPHQLFCIEKGTIIEVSTPDSVEDNYRIKHGSAK
jgi:mannose-6-phosphate isomerase-like protein (cupin superfamily)